MARARDIAWERRARQRLIWRRRFIRVVALLAACASVFGILGTLYAFRLADRARADAQAQIRQLSDTVAQVAVALRTTSGGTTNAASSVDTARTALASTSSTTRSVATTLEDTGKALNINVFGLGQPFAGVEASFRDQAKQIRALADQIDQTGTSLGTNSRDLRTLGGDTTAVAAQMDENAAKLRRLADGQPGDPLDRLASGTRILLIWSIVIHLLLGGLGVALYLLTLDPGLAVPPVESLEDERA